MRNAKHRHKAVALEHQSPRKTSCHRVLALFCQWRLRQYQIDLEHVVVFRENYTKTFKSGEGQPGKHYKPCEGRKTAGRSSLAGPRRNTQTPCGAFLQEPLFDFRAHFCHSAPMETHASRFSSRPTPRSAETRFPTI